VRSGRSTRVSSTSSGPSSSPTRSTGPPRTPRSRASTARGVYAASAPARPRSGPSREGSWPPRASRWRARRSRRGSPGRTRPADGGATRTTGTAAACRPPWDTARIAFSTGYVVQVEEDAAIDVLRVEGDGARGTLRLVAGRLAILDRGEFAAGATLELDGGALRNDGVIVVEDTLRWRAGAVTGFGSARVPGSGVFDAPGSGDRALGGGPAAARRRRLDRWRHAGPRRGRGDRGRTRRDSDAGDGSDRRARRRHRLGRDRAGGRTRGARGSFARRCASGEPEAVSRSPRARRWRQGPTGSRARVCGPCPPGRRGARILERARGSTREDGSRARAPCASRRACR
jgi:hypothetical protein